MFGLKVPSAAASMIRGLLQKVPHERLGGRHDAEELIHHPFFECIDFDALERKEIQVKCSKTLLFFSLSSKRFIKPIVNFFVTYAL